MTSVFCDNFGILFLEETWLLTVFDYHFQFCIV